MVRVPPDAVWPQVPLGGPLPLTPLRPRTPPPHQPVPPSPGALQKEPRGVGGEEGRRGVGGGRGNERAGREGVWLEGRVLQLQWGIGGGLQTPVGARPTSGGSQRVIVLAMIDNTMPVKNLSVRSFSLGLRIRN